MASKMRLCGIVILFGLITISLAGIVTADNNIEDTIKTLDEINDAKDALVVANEGYKDLQKQLSDPTNETLVTENIEKNLKRGLKPLIGDIDDPKDVENTMMRYVYLAFFLAILNGIVIPLITMF
ncbi:MAG: hypothetical protein MUO73_06340, partial [Thermoplasmata archaeon]|nr:hypothetical protein [Thermoplasmata archaeon]